MCGDVMNGDTGKGVIKRCEARVACMVRQGRELLAANTGENLKSPDAGELTFEVMSSSLFSQLNCFSEAHLSILTSGTNGTSKADAQVGAVRERKVGGCMHTGRQAHRHLG